MIADTSRPAGSVSSPSIHTTAEQWIKESKGTIMWSRRAANCCYTESRRQASLGLARVTDKGVVWT